MYSKISPWAYCSQFPDRVRDTSLLFKNRRQKRSRKCFWDCHETLYETLKKKHAHYLQGMIFIASIQQEEKSDTKKITKVNAN